MLDIQRSGRYSCAHVWKLGESVVDQRRCRHIASSNVPTVALICHDFLPFCAHAHNYITRSLDSLHPNEPVYIGMLDYPKSRVI